MAEVEIKNLKNEVVDSLTLDDKVFDYRASHALVWEAVNAFRAAGRKGTHATRNRAAVRGGGKKPWRQKGTGRARVGSIRSPLWRKGGITFGPSPRDYSYAFPKKKRRGAMKLVLTDRLKNGELTIVDEFNLESHRTRDFVRVLESFELDKKVLVIDDRENRNLYLSSRNLPGVEARLPVGVNIHDLLKCQHILISKRAVLALQEVLQR
jgi:large subunit ribosomal protein L4